MSYVVEPVQVPFYVVTRFCHRFVAYLVGVVQLISGMGVIVVVFVRARDSSKIIVRWDFGTFVTRVGLIGGVFRPCVVSVPVGR